MAVGRPKGRTGAETRARIMNAALHRFSRDGYHRAGVRDIAGDVGVTDAALYRHFGSKRGLLLAVFEERGIPQALDALERKPPPGSKRQIMSRMEEDARRLMEREQALIRLVTGEALRGDHDALDVYHSFMKRWTEVATRVLERVQASKPSNEAEAFVRRVFCDFVHEVLLAPAAGRPRKQTSID